MSNKATGEEITPNHEVCSSWEHSFEYESSSPGGDKAPCTFFAIHGFALSCIAADELAAFLRCGSWAVQHRSQNVVSQA